MKKFDLVLFFKLLDHYKLPILSVVSLSLAVFSASFSIYQVVKIPGLKVQPSALTVTSRPEQTTSGSEDILNEIDDSIVVDIGGAVKEPGFYELPSGSRVGDILTFAGGISSSADSHWVLKHINLAQKLTDAAKIYIPFEWEIYQSTSSASANILSFETASSSLPEAPVKTQTGIKPSPSTPESTSKVSINTSSQEELDTLPGIGSVYVAKIIAGRPYKDFQDLSDRSGVPLGTLTKIKNDIVF